MQIRIKTGSNKGKVVPITGLQPIVIGRDSTCGLQIIDRGVSREHARIVRVGEMVFLHDLDSRNGSFVNGERVKEELLREGDTIRVGATQLLFESARSARRADELQYDESDSFQSSLELNINDLYVAEQGETGRQGEHFQAICQAANIFQLERDERVLLDKLLALLLEFIPAIHACIFIRDERTGMVVPQAVKRKDTTHAAPISRSILRKVIAESKAILTADAMQDERFKSGDSIITNNIRSLICVPICSPGNVHGAIYTVNSSLTEAFDQRDLQLVSALGSQLALTLDNLHETMRRRRVYFRIIGRLISTLEGVSSGLAGHGERVSGYCAAMAQELGMSDREIVAAALAGLLHDIGKIPELSGERLEDGELASNTGCSLSAVEILKDIPDLQEDVLKGLLAQYESFDGSGLPGRLRGAEIPQAGRIIAVASAFDKLLYPIGADPGLAPDTASVRTAFEKLEEDSGKSYDPEVIKAMMVAFRRGSLLAIKAPPPRIAMEGQKDEVFGSEEIPVTEAPSQVASEDSLRKVLGSVSRLTTIRLNKEGQPEQTPDMRKTAGKPEEGGASKR